MPECPPERNPPSLPSLRSLFPQYIIGGSSHATHLGARQPPPEASSSATDLNSHVSRGASSCSTSPSSSPVPPSQALRRYTLSSNPQIILGAPENSSPSDSSSTNVVNLRGEERPKTTQSGTRRFLCGTCGRAFAKPSGLKSHQVSHTGERPWVCPFPGCSRRYTVKSNLKRHSITHKPKELERARPQYDTALRGMHQTFPEVIPLGSISSSGISIGQQPATTPDTQSARVSHHFTSGASPTHA